MVGGEIWQLMDKVNLEKSYITFLIQRANTHEFVKDGIVNRVSLYMTYIYELWNEFTTTHTK